jgi:hypothetical protein
MCPLCLSTLAWLAAGTVSAGGIGTLLVTRRQKKGSYDGDDDTPDRKP